MLTSLAAVGGLLLPAVLVALFFLASAVRQVLRRTRPSGRDGGAVATEELHALLYPGKRVQLEQRRIELVLRDDEHDGAPPATSLDLAGGTATIRRPGPRP